MGNHFQIKVYNLAPEGCSIQIEGTLWNLGIWVKK